MKEKTFFKLGSNFKLIVFSFFTITMLCIPVKINHLKSKNTNLSLGNILQQNCYNNERIESITGKKRSMISHKVVKAWKLGTLGFTYGKACELALINNFYHVKKFLNSEFSSSKNLNEKIEFVLRSSELEKAIAQEKVFQADFPSKIKLSNSHIRGANKFSLNHEEREASQEFSSIAERMKYASRCDQKFISEDGFGPLGSIVKQTLSQGSVKEILKYDTSFNGACPGYREMNMEQRKNLWVFIMMSMSHYESSCKENALSKGPNGLASGILQLHKNKEDIYTKWDPDFNCDKGASTKAHKSLKCALTMIGEQIYKGVSFFNDNSHWQVLRKVDKPGSQAYHIRYAISQISACKANPLFYEFDLKVENKKKIEVRHKSSIHQFEVAQQNRVLNFNKM